MAIGNDRYFAWDYSEASDILNIHKKGKKVKESAELADFTVDFDANDNIAGIEIEHASEFFKPLEINTKQLSHMKSAELTIQRRESNYLLIWLKLAVPSENDKDKIVETRIPLPTPVAV